MKKLVFAFAAIVAVSFASCGGNTAATEVADSTGVDSLAEDTTIVEVICDSTSADTATVAE